MKKFIAILLILTTLIIPQLGCNAQVPNSNQGVSKTSFHLDTVCTITVYSMDGAEELGRDEQEKKALLLITDAFKLCDEYEKELSKTVEGSDVYRLNNAGGEWIEVGDAAAAVIKKGIEYGELSGGAFDITIGDVTELWNFHEQNDKDEKVGKLPDPAQLEEAVSHVDYTKIEIDGNRVRLADPKAHMDLGGIAKGYIADRVAEYLEDEGVTSAVVDLGGNIVVVGEKGSSMTESSGKPFSIGVASPVDGRGGLLGTIPCSDKTVVTSGTYERF